MVRNNWSEADVAAMKLFANKREKLHIPISDRALARAIGVSAPRIADLFNYRHGVPTLQEFLALCVVFNIKPSQAMEELDKTKSTDNFAPDANAATVDTVAGTMDESSKVAAVLSKAKRGDHTLAALHDKNKQELIDGEAGPDYADPA